MVAVLDGGAPDPTATDAFEELASVLGGYDVIVYERVWSRAIPAALERALPDATLVFCTGEHPLDNPPGRYLCEGDLHRSLPALLAYMAGERPVLPAHTKERRDGGFRPGLGALDGDEGPRPFAPNLHPVVVPPGALREDRPLSIDGNEGCPYQVDARSNPLYAGLTMPESVGKGCAFCTAGNLYGARSHAEASAHVLGQIRYVRREAPERVRLVLRDQNPFAYLAEVLEACAEEKLGGFTLLLQTRADWLLRAEHRMERALAAAERAGIRVTPFLIGIESFSQAELDRFNKGVTVETNERLLEALRTWEATHAAFNLSEASFGFILFSPWTTLEDLRLSYEGIRRTRLDALRGRILLSRARLYRDAALYYLAERDGLLVAEHASGASDASRRYGYFPAHPWRFRDPAVARFAEVATKASEATGGRDELRLFRCLLEAFETKPAGEVRLEDVLAAFRANGGEGAEPRGATRERESVRPGAEREADGASGESPRGTTAVAPGGRLRGVGPSRHAPRNRSRSTLEVDLGRGCGLPCAVCASPTGDAARAAAEKLIRRGGAQVVLRGAGDDLALIARAAGFAREAGVAEIVLATHATRFGDRAAAARLAALPIDTVLVSLVSHVPRVHDRVVGEEGALVAGLVGMRALAAAGLRVAMEVPVLPGRLSDLERLVDLAHRAVPALASVRFVLSRRPLGAAIAPPLLDEIGPRLDRALARVAALGIPAPLGPTSAIPFCAAVDAPAVRQAMRFDPRGRSEVSGCEHVTACAPCAAKAQCPGVPVSYRRAHGEAGVHPLTTRPEDLYDQRTTPKRTWNAAEREAARHADLLVLRPTVHCNQDCTFCSANETTRNVWADPDKMVRVIARAAQRGVRRLSFSGGEPTLSKDLETFVEVARRSGIAEVEIITNGVLLDRRARVTRLREAGLTHAFVSLHAHDEMLSRTMTRKVSDFERTLTAIDHLLDEGVTTVINHVVNAANHRFLVDFVELVHRRTAGRALISFAFITPQYQALEHMELVPRLSDVAPTLELAMMRALDLGQPFVVGSRQGVPPCLLGPFEAWSDVLDLAHEAASEDAPQKVRSEGCARCRYGRVCTGLWKPYAERHGTGELRPMEGAPFDAGARRAMHFAYPRPFGVPLAFDQVPEALRHPALEAAVRDRLARFARAPSETGPTAVRRALPLVDANDAPDRSRSRPLRVLIVGTGPRARALARAAAEAGGVAIGAVTSPHAPEADRVDFDRCPAYRDLVAALDDTRPEAVVVASSTPSHFEAARLALDAGVPVLVEKPVTTRERDAEALADLAAERGAVLFAAHNDRFAPGIDRFFDAASVHTATHLSIVRRIERDAPDAPVRWSRSAVYESLYHLVVLAHAFGGPEVASVATVPSGERRPERIRAELSFAGGRTVEVTWERDAAVDELVLAAGLVRFRRAGPETTLDSGEGPAPVAREASEAARMWTAFRDAVTTGAAPPVGPRDGLEVMRITRAFIDALQEAGAPFERKDAPRHAASRAVSSRYGR